MTPRGLFIVIDGPDGGGKKTQTDLLSAHLNALGYALGVADFPQYRTPSAGPIELYLNGELGPLYEISAYHAAVLFAVDRYCAARRMREWLAEGRIILSNRYVPANLAYQGGKISDAKERHAFWDWDMWFEYEFFGIPKPTKTLILDVPTDISYDLVGTKAEREYLKGTKRDIHEEDREYLRKAIETYRELAQRYPDEFTLINCAPHGRMYSKSDIAILIWNEIQELLERSKR